MPNVPSTYPSVKATKKSSEVTAIPQTLDAAKRALNSEVVYVRSESAIAEIAPDKLTKNRINLVSCNTFKNELYLNRRAENRPVASNWLAWDERREVEEVVYAPGKERFTNGNLNCWFPSTSKPKKCDISLFHEYMAGLMENAPEFLDWVTAWIAFHIQHPDKKMLNTLMFWSFEQGNGKSTLGWLLRQIYGEHNSSLVRTRLPERFNSYAENKQFIWVDEIEPVRATNRQEEIKSMITQQTITIELKGKTPYDMEDLISYYFTSNHPNALDLKFHDRRFFIHNVGRNSLTSEWFEKKFYPWARTKAAIDGIHHYLLNEVDLSKPLIGGNPDDPSDLRPFSHTGLAPRTDARRQMIEENRDDIETWVFALKDSPADVMGEPHANRTIFTSEELIASYKESSGETRISPQAFRLRLGEALTKLCKGQPVRLPDKRTRLYSTNPTHAKLNQTEVRDHYLSETSTGADS